MQSEDIELVEDEIKPSKSVRLNLTLRRDIRDRLKIYSDYYKIPMASVVTVLLGKFFEDYKIDLF